MQLAGAHLPDTNTSTNTPNTKTATPLPHQQVTLLSCGRLMYHGARDGLVDWFSTLGYHYDAALHGVVSDWALDLVACGSHKPARFYGPKTITTREQVREASQKFVAQWVAVRGLRADDCGAPAKSGRSGKGAAGGLLAAVAARRGAGAAAVSAGGAAACAAEAGGSPGVGKLGAGPSASLSGLPGVAVDELSATSSTWLQQYCWILRREVIMITRNPADVAGRTLTFAWVAFTAGIFYYGLPVAGSGPRLRFNMLLNIIAFYCLIPYVSMSLYTADKKVYLADISAKLFSTSAYYLAKVGGWSVYGWLGGWMFGWGYACVEGPGGGEAC